jgi:phage tail sheath protein FI
VTASGNQLDGSPYMGRKAQRIMVVRAMASTIAANENIRSELIYFNLLSAPGYPELIDEMVNLNTDMKEVAFIVADTPCRLTPSATEIQNWATNPKALPNGEGGLSTHNPYLGVYYPWGLSTNVDGMEVMIPPSTIALRTMAYNDQVAYPWFAPAGYTRGLVTNASTVGYLSREGEFVPAILNQGQRDTLYLNNINPIAFIPNHGLVVYGQKTLNPIASALDRINVARLCNYLKFNLDNLMKPFLFEQNDQQTRDAAKLTTERFLAGLITLRALEDYGCVCDETNNTPERRDRNELWVDIIIKPLKSVEFIYVPVRIRSSAASMTL